MLVKLKRFIFTIFPIFNSSVSKISRKTDQLCDYIRPCQSMSLKDFIKINLKMRFADILMIAACKGRVMFCFRMKCFYQKSRESIKMEDLRQTIESQKQFLHLLYQNKPHLNKTDNIGPAKIAKPKAAGRIIADVTLNPRMIQIIGK